ncbi:MAG: extracellular solute-binding protein [Kiritimatiellae bacterium]|nr:extracellular solute-binding protein [Kiritimatiellia bacterium]
MGRRSFKRHRTADTFERDLRAEIGQGRLRAGDLILSISEICARYGLKPGAVQKALRRLEQEGYVEARHGSGTFVSDAFRKPAVRVYVSAGSPMFDFLRGQVALSRVRAVVTEKRQEADVICGAGIGVHTHAGRGELVAVDRRMRADPPLAQPDWIPGVLERYRSGDRILAVPIYASPVVLLYNQDLFAEAGVRPPSARWQWKDLYRAAEGLRRVCDVEEAGVLPFTNQFTFYVPFLVQNGTSVFSVAGQCRLAGKPALEAIDFLRRLRKACGGTICTKRMEFTDRFLAGRSAMTLWSGHTVKLLAEQQPFRWGWAPLPGERKRATLFLSEGLSVSSLCADQDAAWTFIKQCVADPAQRYFEENTFPFGARASAATEFIRKHGASYRTFLKEIGNATTEHYRFPQVFEVLNREMDGFLEESRTKSEIRAQCELASRVVSSLVGAQGAQTEQLIA